MEKVPLEMVPEGYFKDTNDALVSYPKKRVTALFSGKFDRVHAGHIMSIARLGQEFDKVIVVVLDYPEQEYPISYRVQFLAEMCLYLEGEYEVTSNKTHFGEITKEELDEYHFDIYAAGNHDVLLHIESLGYRVKFVERAYDYQATDDRMLKKIKQALK